jgi:hypothetical protein
MKQIDAVKRRREKGEMRQESFAEYSEMRQKNHG